LVTHTRARATAALPFSVAHCERERLNDAEATYYNGGDATLSRLHDVHEETRNLHSFRVSSWSSWLR